MKEQFRIETLAGEYDRSRFSSGSGPLDRYLREQASQDIKRRIVRCFVAVSITNGAVSLSNREVAGFYTLSAAGIALSDFAPEVVRKLLRFPVIPAALLGRLAVAQSYQGLGLGGVLVADALRRIARVELGVFALIVDAKDEAAQRFYEHYGFTVLPGVITGRERRLCLPIATALRQCERPSENPA